MKILVKIEDGRPLLIFPGEVNKDASVNVYSPTDGHCTASRGYIRRLKNPESLEELRLAWRVLAVYAERAAHQ